MCLADRAAVSPGGARVRKGRAPAGTGSPSASSAYSIETIATSIMSSVGCLVVIFWTGARVEQHLDDRVRAVAGAEFEQLVADRRDDRDEQDPARDHRRRLPADEAEREDREQDHDDQELGAAALVGGRVLADPRTKRVAGLERVDRHVLRAVVLEDPRDVRRASDQGQVAEEDRDPDQALDEVVTPGRSRCSGRW